MPHTTLADAMEGYPPPQEPQTEDELAVAAQAAANATMQSTEARDEMSMQAFTELHQTNEQAAAPAPDGMGMNQPPELNAPDQSNDPYLQAPTDQYEEQYTSTDVPVPPMMEWNNEQHPPAAVPAPRNMDLHSPIHAPEATVNTAATEQPPAPTNEPIYASYAILPSGPTAAPPPHAMHPHPGHIQHQPPHAMTYDPHVYPWHMSYPPPPQGVPMQPPHYAQPPSRPPAPANPHHNSNFWLQEEEERFLLGLRLYGWGQWKRIQTVVQTRSNKQIKSHAQKREKVNPEIKFKYAKGKSRRGRISGKAGEAPSPVKEENLALDDPSLPPMEELWKDVYGTNNGVGPNSRLRRYRSNALHQKWLEEVAEKPDSEKMVATEKTQKTDSNTSNPSTAKEVKKKLSPEGQYIQDNKVLEQRSLPQNHAPMPYYAPPPHGHPYPPHPGYAMPHHSPVRMQPYHPPHHPYHPPIMHQPPVQHHAASPAVQHVQHPPVVHQPNSAPAPAPPTPSVGQPARDESLRPGMRVYARHKNGPTWSPGVIYSAKVDPNKTIDADQSTVPLVYHVQHDGGGEDPDVPEECIVSEPRYDKALDDLERHYELMSGKSEVALEAGLPVYARWMERSNPTTHGKWLPGTIGSFRQEETANGVVTVYHILFDNASEKVDVAPDCVLDRNEYHELVKQKHQYEQPDPSRTPIDEIYNLFNRGDANATGSGQGMDLLFTASQMAAPMDMTKKREADMNGIEGEGVPEAKKMKTEEEGQQQQQQEEQLTLV